MWARLTYSSGTAFRTGLSLLPGESSTFGTAISRERITLYSVPPLGGGVVRRELSIRGYSHYISDARLDCSFDVDFGVLPAERVPDPGVDPGELIVRFWYGPTTAEMEEAIARHDCHIMGGTTVPSGDAFRVWIPFESTTDEMIELLENQPSVYYAEKNIIYSIDEIVYGPSIQYEETHCKPGGGIVIGQVQSMNMIYTSESDFEEINLDNQCYDELREEIDFTAHSLISVSSAVGAGCGDSGIELEGVTYDPGVGKVYAHLHEWDHQSCEAILMFSAWFLIDKVPDDAALEVVTREGGWGSE